ncbi:hypothetical protein [Kribbella sp. HUAS MG21]|uniref:Uncharacterized protein n=1 Tax=Kribbella sp. HUAS MG21 TaxID=3160966 RepID=A0AAU7TPR1_9ACTN
MPLQNRVLPTQEIVADPGRGLLMGNRGSIHRPDRTLGVTRWRSKAWICCALDFQGRRRDPMPPGRWTALFFFDEAVALAAGHRPCHYCRRSDFLRYAGAWPQRLRAAEMDAVLHSQRVDPRTRRQRTTTQYLSELPDGAMLRFDGSPALVLDRQLLPWSWQGYGAPVRTRGPQQVEVLTPPANLVVLRAGFAPLLHPSASSQLR